MLARFLKLNTEKLQNRILEFIAQLYNKSTKLNVHLKNLGSLDLKEEVFR